MEKTKKSPRLSLWCFLKSILDGNESSHLITWTDKDKLEFKLLQPKKLAQIWGKLNDKGEMSYAKFSRALRYYIGKGLLEKVPAKQFCYRFVKIQGNARESTRLVNQEKTESNLSFEKSNKEERQLSFQDCVKDHPENNEQKVDNSNTYSLCYVQNNFTSASPSSVFEKYANVEVLDDNFGDECKLNIPYIEYNQPLPSDFAEIPGIHENVSIHEINVQNLSAEFDYDLEELFRQNANALKNLLNMS